MDNFVIIDGNSLINRAFYALPPLNNADGVPTQAVYGFVNMLVKSIQDFSPKYLAVAFDLPKPTFRHLRYDGYKAKRKKMPEELAVQLPLLKELLKLMNVRILECEGYEADDIIGTVAKHCEGHKFIVTGDRDSLQLIDDTTTVVLTKRGITDTQRLDEAGLKEAFSLTPSQVIDFKALSGDASDNIPGIAGIGEKTALGLLEQYGSLDGIYENVQNLSGKLREKIENGKESAYLSYFLATINTDSPIDVCAQDCILNFPFSSQVRQYFIRNNFRSLVKREDLFAQEGDAPVVETVETSSRQIFDEQTLEDALTGRKEIAYLFTPQAAQIAVSETEQIEIPIKMNLIDEGVDLSLAFAWVGKYLSDPNIKKYVFDGKKELYTLDKFAIDLQNFDDVRLMQFLLDHTVDTDKEEDYFSGLGMGKHGACNLFALAKSLMPSLEEESMSQLYREVELPLERVLYDMEKKGVTVDRVRLRELGEEFSGRAKQLAFHIYELAGKEFNINSPKQLASVLFEDLAIPFPFKGKKVSTGADVLEDLEDRYPICAKILQYRFVTKLNSTYVEGIEKLLDSRNKVHTEYKQMLTTTGRLSSVEPNLQNIPTRDEEGKLLRGIFVADEGKVLMSADYSQIELRLLAHFSADPVMVKSFNDRMDLHAAMASRVFGVPVDQITPQMRRDAKTVNFGIIYGISEFGLSKNLKCSLTQAKRYITTYFEQFKAVRAYFDEVVEQAKKDGYTTTLLHRKRRIPELNSPNYMQRQFGERAASNMPLQGSAADIIKVAMVSVAEKLKNTNSKMILQIHDELIVEADEREADEVAKILKESMEGAYALRVPLEVEVGIGKSWYDCK